MIETVLPTHAISSGDTNAIREMEWAIETSGQGVSVLDTEGRYQRVSKLYAGTLGFEPDELVGKTWKIAVPEDEVPLVEDAYQKMLHDGHVELECRGIRRNGAIFHKHLALVKLLNDDGRHMGHYCFARDISHRRKREEFARDHRDRVERQRHAFTVLALDASMNAGDLERAFRLFTEQGATALQTSRVSVWRLSADGSELRCLSLYDQRSGDHQSGTVLPAESYPAYFEAIHSQGRIAATDARTDPDTAEFTEGYLVPLDIHSMLDCGIMLDGRLAGVVCFEHTGEMREWQPDEEAFAATLTALVSKAIAQEEKNRMANQMLASEQRLAAVVGSAVDAIVTIDNAGIIESANPAAEKMFGYQAEEMVGNNVNMLMPPPFAEEHDGYLRRYRESGVAKVIGIGGEVEGLRKNGSPIQIDLSVSETEIAGQTRYIGILRDISERKRLEEETRKLEHQYFQSQKLESVGHLAGGVAHDFNNLLTVIMGAGEILRDEIGPEAQLDEFVDDILTTSVKARDLVRQLMIFSRQQAMEMVCLDLNKLLREFEKFMRRTLRENIRIDVIHHPVPQVVDGDPCQLEQVLMNLVVNAQDAMPDGGSIRIELCGDAPPRDGRRDLILKVSDTGNGIPEEIRGRIFEPFFTTKDRDGRGTGLGLATTYGIISKHHGSIEMESEEGRGTTFTIHLPIHDGPAHDVESKDQHEAQPRGAETILLAEDDLALQRITTRSLQRNGYTVHAASNGEDALRLLKEHEADINLLLTDVVMPGMSGPQLVEQATALDPSLKVLYMSGYTDDIMDPNGDESGKLNFISKPFAARALIGKIRQVLEEN